MKMGQKISAVKTCNRCKKAFKLEQPNQRYCRQCTHKECKQCGETFRIQSKNTNTFCSRKCADVSGARSKPPIDLTCQNCGITFRKKIGYNRKKYCTPECRYEAARTPNPGSRRNHEYRRWKKSVFSRDNHTCQHCGSQSNLQAHHVAAWANHPELRYETSNGLTVCTACHARTHGAKQTGRPATIRRCTECDATITGRGKSSMCRGCSLRHSPKAKKQRSQQARGENGRFIPQSPA